MSMPTPSELEEQIQKEIAELERLEKVQAHFLAEWKRLEKEQAETIASLRNYMEKIKMRDVLEHIHSIKE